MPLVITVRGEHESWHPAERGIVHLTVTLDGPNRDIIFTLALQASDAVRALITPLASTGGAITRWSSDTVRVTAQRPWNNAGEQLPLVHSASIDFVARFRDFDALTIFIEDVSALPDTTVSQVEWELTRDTARESASEARGLAVADALAKAREYASSVGLDTVAATAIADPGMLDSIGTGDGGDYSVGSANMRMMSHDVGSGPQLALKPEQISVSASVEARFSAS